MFNFGFGSFCQADIDINMEVPSQLRHLIRAGGWRTRVNLTPFEKSIACSAIRIRGILGLLAENISNSILSLGPEKEMYIQ